MIYKTGIIRDFFVFLPKANMLDAGKFCNVADRSIFDMDVDNSCGCR